MEDLDKYAGWLASKSSSKNVVNVNRYKKEFENKPFGEKYWLHRKNNADVVHNLPARKSVEMPYFTIPDAAKVIRDYD